MLEQPLPSAARSVRGLPLPRFVRSLFEPLFRTSFSEVRLHIGPQPASIGARAFVRGDDLYVHGRCFEPHSISGLRLLAHELAHIQQQREGRTIRFAQAEAGLVADPLLEAEAEWIAEDVMTRLNKLSPAMPGTCRTRPAPIRIFPAVQLSANSYQIAGGNEDVFAGGVLVRKTSPDSIVLNDLEVRPRFRKQGLGRALLSAALATGSCLGAAKAILVSQDAGTGHLTHWYEGLGFTQFGWHMGFPKLVTYVDRAVSGCGPFSPPLMGGWVQCMKKKKARAKPVSLADFHQTTGPQPAEIFHGLAPAGTIDPELVFFSQTRAGSRYTETFKLGGGDVTTLQGHVAVLAADLTDRAHETTPAIEIVFYKGCIMCITGNRRLYVHRVAKKPINYIKRDLTNEQIENLRTVDPEAPRYRLTVG